MWNGGKENRDEKKNQIKIKINCALGKKNTNTNRPTDCINDKFEQRLDKSCEAQLVVAASGTRPQWIHFMIIIFFCDFDFFINVINIIFRELFFLYHFHLISKKKAIILLNNKHWLYFIKKFPIPFVFRKFYLTFLFFRFFFWCIKLQFRHFLRLFYIYFLSLLWWQHQILSRIENSNSCSSHNKNKYNNNNNFI